MIMMHDDGCLTQTKVYVVRLVFGANVKRFHFSRYIGLIRQAVNRSRGTYGTVQVNILQRHKTLDQFKRHIIQIDICTKSIGVQGRRIDLHVDIMIAQVLILIYDAIEF